MGAVAVIGNNEALSRRKRKSPAVSQLHGGVAGQQMEHMATIAPMIRKIAGLAFDKSEALTRRLLAVSGRRKNICERQRGERETGSLHGPTTWRRSVRCANWRVKF